MRQTKKALAKYAGAGALALLIATSAFAAPAQWQRGSQPATSQPGRSRAVSNVPTSQNSHQSSPPQRGTTPSPSYGWNGQNGRQSSPPQRGTAPSPSYGSHHPNDRVNGSGRVTSISRDRDGYRVRLDRGDSFWIPSTRLGNRARDLRVGVSIGLGGFFQGGIINVDTVTWPGASGFGYGYDQGSVSGVVERIDYRSGTMLLRDDASGLSINVDMRTVQRTSLDLRPGDYVTLSGNWVRANVFDAYRIDAVGNAGY